MNIDALRKFDREMTRTPLRRFTYGASAGLVAVLGMWIISTLSHSQNYGFGLTWQFAVTVVLFWGILSLGVRRKK